MRAVRGIVRIQPHRTVTDATIAAPESDRAPRAARPVVRSIAVDATRLRRDLRGIGRYVRAMLPRFAALRPDLSLGLFVRNADDLTATRTWIAEHPVLRGRAEAHHARHFADAAADVHWYPWNVAPALPRRGTVVATVHDIAPIVRARFAWDRWKWTWRFHRTVRAAHMLVADSAFTAHEVQRVLAVPSERIRVVHLAADAFPDAGHADDLARLERLGVRPPFVLSVGATDRRKNMGVLDEAMARVSHHLPDLLCVQVGPRRRSRMTTGTASAMRVVGRVDEADLAAAYRCAEALVLTSTYEGFGLPVVEAMQLGTPVICAKTSSLPEVAGDAAWWIDPTDPASVQAAIEAVASDPATRARLREAGLAQATRFSWDRTAAHTLAAFDDALRARIAY